MWSRRGRAVAVAAVLALLMLAPVTQGKSVGKPRRRPIDAVIVHSLGGPDCRNGIPFFKQIDGDARTWRARFAALPIVSIHYVIGRDGQLESGIPEHLAASHAVGWNQRSIGIELVNNGDGIDPFPEPQLSRLIALVRDIRTRHPKVTPARILRHSDVDQSTFPESTFGAGCSAFRRKLDPGEAFPWEAFKAQIGPD